MTNCTSVIRSVDTSGLRASDARRYPKLFIVGAPRSGTTWTQRIFQSHPHVATAPETMAFPEVYAEILRYGCHRERTWERLVGDYRYRCSTSVAAGVHNFVTEQEFKQIIRRAQGVAARNADWSDSEAAGFVVRQVFDCFFSRSRDPAPRLLVEKSPAHVFWGHLILRLFPDSKLLVVLRDGRDVCVSLQMVPEDTTWVPRQREGQIHMWKTYVEAGLELLDEFPERVARVRYEDLHASPHDAVGRLMDFAGLEHNAEQIASTVAATRFTPKRGHGTHNFWRKGVVGDWKNHFLPDEERLFANLAGELSERIGYALSSSQNGVAIRQI